MVYGIRDLIKWLEEKRLGGGLDNTSWYGLQRVQRLIDEGQDEMKIDNYDKQEKCGRDFAEDTPDPALTCNLKKYRLAV